MFEQYLLRKTKEHDELWEATSRHLENLDNEIEQESERTQREIERLEAEIDSTRAAIPEVPRISTEEIENIKAEIAGIKAVEVRGEKGEKGEPGKDGRDGVDGKPGRDGITKIVTEVVEENLPAEEIRDRLQTLKGNDRLDASAIKNLPEAVTQVVSMGGGGQTIYRIETSTTTATINNNIDVHICNGESDYTLTMPGFETGKQIRITNIGTGTVTISGPVDNTTALTTLYEGESCAYLYNGTNWI